MDDKARLAQMKATLETLMVQMNEAEKQGLVCQLEINDIPHHMASLNSYVRVHTYRLEVLRRIDG
ncbi:hypothetical protein [Brucella intermedia]|uniref:hypothetical protein n=1 Tax=Brucella intermedia TaxID=94625 RepID=UPI00224B79CF|nr:hypothetical protein [Brucella intermedia]